MWIALQGGALKESQCRWVASGTKEVRYTRLMYNCAQQEWRKISYMVPFF